MLSLGKSTNLDGDLQLWLDGAAVLLKGTNDAWGGTHLPRFPRSGWEQTLNAQVKTVA